MYAGENRGGNSAGIVSFELLVHSMQYGACLLHPTYEVEEDGVTAYWTWGTYRGMVEILYARN